MNNTLITHQLIVNYFDKIHRLHKGINGFFRANFSEIEGSFRSGIGTPALVLESPDNDIDPNQNQVASFNTRTISFMVLDHATWDNYDLQEAVLDKTEAVALDIASFINRDRKDVNHWLYGKYDGVVKMQKVGPIFDSMFGWNVIMFIKNKQPMCFEPEKWFVDSE